MGYMKHDVVFAVLWRAEDAAKVRQWVEALPLFNHALGDVDVKPLFAFLPGIMNGYTTVVMGPDGSKEGWEHSKIGDGVRAEFKAFLSTLGVEGGVVHVSMPEDDAPFIVGDAPADVVAEVVRPQLGKPS